MFGLAVWVCSVYELLWLILYFGVAVAGVRGMIGSGVFGFCFLGWWDLCCVFWFCSRVVGCCRLLG